jgi:2-C-methyl-D-erythritol 4-phosphate cytidylyltransferase
MKKYAIILASGTGSRSGLNKPKQFFKVAGKTIFEHTVSAFEKHREIDGIIIAVHSDFIDYCHELTAKNSFGKIVKIIAGGETRQASSMLALNVIEEAEAYVLIHDAVRPFLPEYVIDRSLEALKENKAVDTAIPSADTLIEVDGDHYIKNIPPRNSIYRGQTPQSFHLSLIKEVHKRAAEAGDSSVTDDCSLVLRYSSEKVYVVEGDNYNHKITYPIDIAIVNTLFQMRTAVLPKNPLEKLGNQVIVIFGAGSGIGQAAATLAAEHKARVFGFSLASGYDVSKSEDITRALDETFKATSRIDAVIVTAGVLNMGKIQERSMDDIRKEVAINYLAAIDIARQSFSYLQKSRGQLILFTSSSYTLGRALYAVYSSAKAAVVNLMQALADEWSDDGIRVNVICPERTATPMRFNNFGNEDPATLLTAEEVAEATLNTLVGQETGQVVEVLKQR